MAVVTSKKNFGATLKIERKKKKWSQEDLASKAQVTQGMVSKWESGDKTPSFDNLIMLSKVFNLPLTTFVNGDVFSKDELKKMAESKADDLLSKELEAVMQEQDLVKDLTQDEVKEALEYIKARRIMRRANS